MERKTVVKREKLMLIWLERYADGSCAVCTTADGPHGEIIKQRSEVAAVVGTLNDAIPVSFKRAWDAILEMQSAYLDAPTGELPAVVDVSGGEPS